MKFKYLVYGMLCLLLSGCIPMSTVSYAPPPPPAKEFGLVYLYHHENPGKLRSGISLAVDEYQNRKPFGAALLNNGEYSWVHLPIGNHQVSYTVSDGRQAIIRFVVSHDKATFIEASQQSAEYSIILNVANEKDGMATVQKFKYVEFDFDPKPCFVLTCRKK